MFKQLKTCNLRPNIMMLACNFRTLGWSMRIAANSRSVCVPGKFKIGWPYTVINFLSPKKETLVLNISCTEYFVQYFLGFHNIALKDKKKVWKDCKSQKSRMFATRVFLLEMSEATLRKSHQRERRKILRRLAWPKNYENRGNVKQGKDGNPQESPPIGYLII